MFSILQKVAKKCNFNKHENFSGIFVRKIFFFFISSFLDNLKYLPKIEEKRINIVKKIGNGAFGEVYFGFLSNKNNMEMQIAIKVDIPFLNINVSLHLQLNFRCKKIESI